MMPRQSARAPGPIGELLRTIATFLALAVAGCASTNLDPVESPDFEPAWDEQELWDDAKEIDDTILASDALFVDESIDEYINEIADRLLPHLGAADAKVNLRVFDDPYLNGFTMPNGSIYLNLGLLASAENESQLATIIGHELSHYIRRHSLEEYRIARNRYNLAIAGSAALAILGGVIVPPNSLGFYLAEVRTSGHSRENERESDFDAFAAIQQAGYPPEGVPRIFEHLEREALEMEQPDDHYGSHPRLKVRVGYAKEWHAEQLPTNPAQSVEPIARDYDQKVAPALLRTARLSLVRGYRAHATRSVERYLVARPDDADGHLFHARVAKGRLARSDDRARVAAAYEAALRADPENPQANRALGLIRLFEGDLESAQQLLSAYLVAKPEAPDRAVIKRLAEGWDMAATKNDAEIEAEGLQ